MSPAAPRYAVYGPGEDDPLIIDAENWVFALGTALELLEREDCVSRLSCEVHPDGTVVAEDKVTETRFLVHRVPYSAYGAYGAYGANKDAAQGPSTDVAGAEPNGRASNGPPEPDLPSEDDPTSAL